MTLLVRTVAELVGAIAVWAALLAATTSMVAVGAHLVVRRLAGMRRSLTWAFVGGAVAMAAAHRLGLADPLGFSVWRREVLVVWAAAGAAAATWAALSRDGGSGSVGTTESVGDQPRREVAGVDEFQHLLADHDGTMIAVVGATDSPGKYGGIIYRDLKRKGYRVYAVNPGRDTVDGDPCYPSLADLPATPHIVDFVVPPSVTLESLRRCLDLGLMRVWIQPGAADAEVRRFIDEHGFTALVGACIMVEAHPR